MKKILPIILCSMAICSLSSCGGGNIEEAKKLLMGAKTTTLASTYKYDYSLSASVKFPLFNISPAKMTGQVLYNGNQYLNKKENSGILMIDSTTYTFNQGNDLIKINTKKDDFEVVNKENFTLGYDFESSSVGKIFKALSSEDIIDIKNDSSNKHKFKIGLGHTTFKNKFLSALNVIDLTIVFNILNKISQDKWGLAFKPDCYFILDDNDKYVKNFHFDLNLEFKDIVNVIFKLDQNFSQIGGSFDVTIPPVLKDCYFKSEEIDSNIASLKTSFENSKDSYYTYKLKTAVDHGMAKGNPLGLAVNSTSKGFAERKSQNGTLYFHNELELDSDYKNKDQYKGIIDDYKYTRARVSNDNSVWDVKAQLGTDEYHSVSPYANEPVDDYYMLPKEKWFSSSYVKALRKTTESDNTTTWKLGLSNEAIKEMLTTYNASIRLDKDLIKWIDVYDIKGDFNAKNFEYIITTDTQNKIAKISIVSKGTYTMNQTEVSEEEDIKFGFELSIEFEHGHDEYEIPATKDKIKAS
ncbi:MAG: hypothetical protein MJ213_00490 [Bacilli bacterium]|nr:hypothetical protein [Bacilli bacterium]